MTYSLVARCPETGRLGVGVQSHYFACGAIVPWVRANVGAIATQASGDAIYGIKGLELLEGGVPPSFALQQLLKEDPLSQRRQVAYVNRHGDVAAHTGDECIGYASHKTGVGVVFLANMMTHDNVPVAMASAWEETEAKPLEFRLLASLKAAQAAGGDIRGQQAAGIKVVDPVDYGHWWKGATIDIRVDDHPEPLRELERLLNLQEAFRIADNAEKLAAVGEFENADKAFHEARKQLPQSAEIAFWHGVMLANAGQIKTAKEALTVAFQAGNEWRELLTRIHQSNRLNVDSKSMSELVEG